MTFTTPALLWALPLAAAPILLHLLSRRRAARRLFSELSLLRRVHARALPRTRLRQWLLVAARCALLLALIVAYAGPVLRAGARAGGDEGLDLAVLVDVSYSMRARALGKTRLDAGLAQASALLKRLKPGDRAAVALFSDRLESEEPAWTTPEEAAARLARARPTYRGTDLSAAWRAGAGLFAGSPGRRRRALLVVSDGARHARRGGLPALPPDVAVVGLSWPAVSGNSALLSAGPSRDSTAQRPELAARAALAAGAPASLELSVDGRASQSGALSASSGEASAALALPPAADAKEPAWSGQASLRADALPEDDAYYFSFRHPARPRLAVLYGEPDFPKAPSGGYFLKQLLGTGRESLLDYDADFVELDRFEPARLAAYRAVVLAGFKELPAGLAADLEAFVRRGGGLLVVAGGRAEASGAAALPWLPARLGPLVSGEGAGIKVAESGPWRELDLDRLVVGRYYLLQTRPGAKTLVSSPSGYPLLVAGAVGAGRTLVWASGLDTAWTNLPVKPAFAPLLELAFGRATAATSRRSETLELKVGRPLERSWPEDEPAPASVRLRGPDGRATTLWLKNRRVASAPLELPGLYALTEEGSGRRLVYAVNLDRAGGESDLTPMSDPPWRALSADDLAGDFEREVYGRPARLPALGAAAVAAALEMLLALPQGALAAALLALALSCPASAQQGDRFVWTQLKLGPQWDPYPTAPAEVLDLFGTVTSVLTAPERRVISPRDKALFSSPLVVLAGGEAPPELDGDEVRALRDYVSAGGMLWLEDVSGSSTSSFDRWVRRTLPRVLPEGSLAPLPAGHVLYKTFFLLRSVGGRVLVRSGLEGVDWAGRTAVVYSRNDLLGVWAKDHLGQPLYPCTPGGEPQRHLGRKLTVNILMYALTGSYKADAVHQPYLLQKMRSGAP